MQNFLFRFNDHEYVTLFGINYLNKTVEDTLKLPDGVINAVRKTFSASAELTDINVTTNMSGQCVATANVKLNGKMYRLDTANDVNPLREIAVAVPPIPEKAEEASVEDVKVDVEEVPDDTITASMLQASLSPSVPTDTHHVFQADESLTEEVGDVPETSMPTLQEEHYTAGAEVPQDIAESSVIAEEDTTSISTSEQSVNQSTKESDNTNRERLEDLGDSEPDRPTTETSSVMKYQESATENTVIAEPKVETPKYNPVFLRRIDAYTLKPVSLEEVAQKGDAYCEMNGWTKADQVYMIDDVVSVMRYVHSDALNINEAIPYEEVANSGKN